MISLFSAFSDFLSLSLALVTQRTDFRFFFRTFFLLSLCPERLLQRCSVSSHASLEKIVSCAFALLPLELCTAPPPSLLLLCLSYALGFARFASAGAALAVRGARLPSEASSSTPSSLQRLPSTAWISRRTDLKKQEEKKVDRAGARTSWRETATRKARETQRRKQKKRRRRRREETETQKGWKEETDTRREKKKAETNGAEIR
uniref:Transmembrane protein n=1 Tax=Toxoplasma gondii TgCATBr9 TaxID=943120 RepID=A0A2T6IJQ3_TOXGO|nr:hypothetical protein TGBR9_360560 [Toxoplasma gondii TgCATBr9]